MRVLKPKNIKKCASFLSGFSEESQGEDSKEGFPGNRVNTDVSFTGPVRIRLPGPHPAVYTFRAAAGSTKWTGEKDETKNRQLQTQLEQLKEVEKAKSRFFANISHEFRTPLTLLKGSLEQILADKPNKELETKTNMMLRNTRCLLNLVEQLLELAKFDSGQMKLTAALRNIVPLVKSIVTCFESLALQNKVELTFQVEAENISLYFDREKLERIITNLLSNAFNYTPPGGKIRVSIRTVVGTAYPSGCVEITVFDTGSGIPADQLQHIFERFYRGKSSHDYNRSGAGIGLALSMELVELHHGEIEVHSSCRQDHTRGTEFTLRLPMGNGHLQPGEIINETVDIKTAFGDQAALFEKTAPLIGRGCQPPPAKTFEENKTGPGAPETAEKDIILVVEDNADMRSYIRGALEPHFNVKEAANGKEAVRKTRELIPDLVISDILMPEVDGYQLCATLRKNIKTSHIPIILLTAKASETSMAEGLETGADDYIVKPFNTKILVTRVKNLVRLRRQLQRKIQNDILLQPEEISTSSLDRDFIKELHAVMEKHLPDPEFTVEQLAKTLYMSPSSLYRKVEALTGETTTQFIRSYRLKRAAQLLKSNFGNVTEVAFAVGFSNTAYFTKCFKKKFHRLPHNYQASKPG